MRMRKVVSVLILASLTMLAFGQENTKQREVGISFYSINSFGLSYKVGTAHSMWRIGSIFGTGDNSQQESDLQTNRARNFNLGLTFGKERRRTINDKLMLAIGWDLRLGYSKSTNETTAPDAGNYQSDRRNGSVRVGLGLVLGMHYQTESNFIIGGELIPSVNYRRSKETLEQESDSLPLKEEETTTNRFYGGFSTSSLRLVLAYRF